MKNKIFLLLSLVMHSIILGQIVDMDVTSISIVEKTTETYVHNFDITDERLFQNIIKEDYSQYDFSTLAHEYFDIYISDHNGVFDSLGSYLTIDCYFVPNNFRMGLGNNIDAVGLNFADQSVKYAGSITKFELGFSKPDTAFFDSLGFIHNCLGPPDNKYSRLGIFRTSITLGGFQLFTSVQQKKYDVSSSYKLEQNYPNPFNPDTIISFNLSQQSMVTLEIFDIKGEKVITLANEIYPSGSYEMNWNGNNNFDQLMPSGVYFYRIKVDNNFKVMRMMLLK